MVLMKRRVSLRAWTGALPANSVSLIWVSHFSIEKLARTAVTGMVCSGERESKPESASTFKTVKLKR